jgi:hypothetical protein
MKPTINAPMRHYRWGIDRFLSRSSFDVNAKVHFLEIIGNVGDHACQLAKLFHVEQFRDHRGF